MVYILYMTSQNTYIWDMTCLYHGYDCPLKTIEHIYVISTGYTLNKVLIRYIYLVYPTPTFCVQKWVEHVGWCRKSGAGPAAQKPPTMVLVGPDRGTRKRGPDRGTRKGTCECASLFTANTGISGCLRH